LILKDMIACIDKDFPIRGPFSYINPTTAFNIFRERRAHHRYAANLSQVYISQDEYFSKLDNYMNIPNPVGKVGIPIFVVTGQVGSGKTSLLAKWITMRREENKKIKN